MFDILLIQSEDTIDQKHVKPPTPSSKPEFQVAGLQDNAISTF